MGYGHGRQRREMYAKQLRDVEVCERIILKQIGEEQNDSM
jgi:hypothetical protein